MPYSKTVFADTSALYLLFLAGRPSADLCRGVFEDLVNHYKATCLTTTWVKYETLTRLRKHGLRACESCEALLKKREVFRVIPVSPDTESKALQYFWNWTDKSIGIVDWTSIQTMWQNNIYYAFAADDHFRQAGLFPLVRRLQGRLERAYSTLQF